MFFFSSLFTFYTIRFLRKEKKLNWIIGPIRIRVRVYDARFLLILIKIYFNFRITLDSSICLGRPLKSTAIFIIFCHATHKNTNDITDVKAFKYGSSWTKQSSAPNFTYLIVCALWTEQTINNYWKQIQDSCNRKKIDRFLFGWHSKIGWFSDVVQIWCV